MAKKRIGDIASAHDLNPKEVVKQLQEAGFSVQSPTSTIEERLALKVLNTGGNGAQKQAEQPAAPPEPRRVQPAGSQPRPQERRVQPPKSQPRPQRERPQGGGQRGGGPGGQRPQAGGAQRPPQGQRRGGPPSQRPPQQRDGQGQRGGGRGGQGGAPRQPPPTRDDPRTRQRAPSASARPRRLGLHSP